MMMIRVKIMPDEVGRDLKEITKKIEKIIPNDSVIKKQEIEPVAFGLESLILTIQTPDEEGMIDNIEESIGSIKEVVNVTVISASRLSTKLP
tara:strand:- start:426 stop:701 length:276 start_codon:yes stop_codon:yes gene_type:complete